MSKKVTKKEHKKHVNHVLLYTTLVTAVILTAIISVMTIEKFDACEVPVTGRSLESIYGSCGGQIVEQTRFGWPISIGDSVLGPLIANFGFVWIVIYGLARAEAHIKGHIHVKK